MTSPHRARPRLAVCLLATLVTAGLAACGGSSSSPTPIQLSVSAGQSLLLAGQSTQIKVTELNDPTDSGVAWNVSCAQSDCGALSGTTFDAPSGLGSATYTAPQAAPPADLTVTITVTAVADATITSSVKITISNTALTLSLAGVTVVPAGMSTPISANLVNDGNGAEVNWTVSCATAPCGTLSPSTTISGAPATYNAPAVPPAADLAVTLTATSTGSPVLSASVTITVPAPSLSLSLPSGTIVPAGSSTAITATLIDDGSNTNSAVLTWTVTCPAAPCGSLTPLSTANGAPAKYTAPPAPPGADLSVTLTATVNGNSALSAAVTITVPAIQVGVTAAGSTDMTAGTSQQLTATVNYDPAGKGVTWTLTCSAADCGALSPLSSASGQAVTYTAPATPPPADLQVTVTAQSVSAPAHQGQLLITVKAVSVGIQPISALVPLGVTQQFTAGVGYDPSASGVSWQLLQGGTACAGACGTVAPLTSASGAPVTYTAPASLPANTTVNVKAASVTESSSSVTGTVVVTKGSVRLAPLSMSFVKTLRLRRPPPQTATLTNTGRASLQINSITISGTGAAHFGQSNTCVSAVAAGASCTITVTYGNNPSRGSFAALLSISDSSADSPQKIALSGSFAPAVSALVHSARTRAAVLAAPPPTGAQPVGTRELHLIDSTRADPYLPGGGRRELMVRFWYPMSGGSDVVCNRADYTATQTWDYLGTLLGTTMPQVLTNSCRDAAIAPGPHPLVLVSHGFTGTATDYTFLAEDLASRGYVVVAVDHTHEATAVAFPDGRLEKSVLGSYLTDDWHSDPASLSLASVVRLADLRFVLNQLAALNSASDGRFTASLDLRHIAIVGHSLGGLTALRALEDEPRIKAAVLLDAVVPPGPAAPMPQPVLHVVAGRSWNETDCSLWDSLSGARVAVAIPGAEHLTFSDAVWLLPGSLGTGSAPETMIAATRDTVAAFLDASLGGKDPGSALARLDLRPAGAVVVEGSQSLCSQP